MPEGKDEIFERQLSLVDVNNALEVDAWGTYEFFRVEVHNLTTEKYFLHSRDSIKLYYFDEKNALWQEIQIAEVTIIPAVVITGVDLLTDPSSSVNLGDASNGFIWDESTTVTVEPNGKFPSHMFVIEPRDWSIVRSAGEIRVLLQAENANSQASAYDDIFGP